MLEAVQQGRSVPMLTEQRAFYTLKLQDSGWEAGRLEVGGVTAIHVWLSRDLGAFLSPQLSFLICQMELRATSPPDSVRSTLRTDS